MVGDMAFEDEYDNVVDDDNSSFPVERIPTRGNLLTCTSLKLAPICASNAR